MAAFPPLDFATVRGAPLLGSLAPISRDALGLFTRLLSEQGDRVWLRVPGRSILLLCHPEDIEQVLVRDRESYGRSAEVRKLKPIFGDGLLSSEGELWRRQRALIQPSFQHDALARYASIMLATIRRQVAEWRNGEVRDIYADMMRYTREVICSVLFGESFLAGQRGLGEAVSTVFGDLRSEILYLPIWRRLPSARSRRWNQAVAVLNRAVGDAIRSRRGAGRLGSGESHDDLLQALLDARGAEGEAMPDAQLHDEILTFFLAGHETAALSLTWAMHLVAQEPELQAAIGAEVSAAQAQRADLEGVLRPADASSLRLTSAVMKETLRLYPPVWSMGREVSADTTLGGARVPQGTGIWICLHRTHRDPRWYTEPDRFLPARWLDGQAVRPFAYLPFGMGPRVCIGQHFATMEGVLGLAAMLAEWRLTPEREGAIEPSAWITLRPKRPVRLRVERVNETVRGR